MALFTCPECKKKISEHAAACPNCGAPVRRDQVEAQRKNQKYGWFFAAIIIIVVLVKCSGDDAPKSAGTSGQAMKLAAKEEEICEKDFDAISQRALEASNRSSGAAVLLLNRCAEKAPEGVDKEALIALSSEYQIRAKEEAEKAELARKEAELARMKADPQQQWQYSESKDAMTDKKTSTAQMLSKNSLNLDFPYNRGSNYARLFVRQHPQYGLDVIMTIEQGQILCQSYDPCSVKVRFDDKPVMTFSGGSAADNSSETVFIRNPQRFINNAKTAKKIRIQIPVYQGGEPVLEFETIDNLVWPVAAKK